MGAFINEIFGIPIVSQWVKNLTNIHEDVDSIPGQVPGALGPLFLTLSESIVMLFSELMGAWHW